MITVRHAASKGCSIITTAGIQGLVVVEGAVAIARMQGVWLKSRAGGWLIGLGLTPLC